MATNPILQAKQVNHGQSEIWLEADGKEITPHRTLATNEVVNVVRRHTDEEVFKKFYADYHEPSSTWPHSILPTSMGWLRS